MRVATHDDLDAVVETISTAFHHDPVWSWAFPDATARSVKKATEQSGPSLFAGSSAPRPASWKSRDPGELGPIGGPKIVWPLGPSRSKTPWKVLGSQSRQLPLPP